MKNSAFEQPARTNSRSLLFRSRRRGRPCRRGSLSGLASYSMASQSWRVVPRILSMGCTLWASTPVLPGWACWKRCPLSAESASNNLGCLGS
jgi:hypothetical protein